MSLIPSVSNLTGFKTRTEFENGKQVMIDYIEKDPDAVLDYLFDWYDGGNGWLGSDTISTSTWILDTGLTADSSTVDGANQVTTVWISGGTAQTWDNYGSWYKVTNRIVTVGGRTNDRTFYVWCREL